MCNDHEFLYSTREFEETYTYHGSDLGAVWAKEKTVFRVWAPTATAVTVLLYTGGTDGADDCIGRLAMAADVNGTWVAEKAGDLNGVYYTYLADIGGETREACDPYARTTGINGRRAMVIDLASTDPAGWERDADPHAGNAIADAIIYELHVRDLSMDEGAGIQNKGKFLGLTETGTKTPGGIPTGLDHIKALGITHLHLLPIFDYGSVDEQDPSHFNWGYDPENFNVPEGSYSTDPCNGAVRVRELKQTVKTLHDSGISVVMDVVYNHVYHADAFCFNQIVPGYFSRPGSNGSFCGNDTATERSMVRKYIIDSVNYWADEYHIDGFRFDLVGLIDVQTVREVMETVHRRHPNVVFYGEGWTMPTVPTKKNTVLATQHSAHLLPGFAFFSDNFRDMLRGTVLEDASRGFVSGEWGKEQDVQNCYLARNGWSDDPTQSIQYGSCHDNRTLFDQLCYTAPGRDPIRMNKLSAAMTLTAQGVPFFQAGEEFLRSKGGSDNSYNLPDSVNILKWRTLEDEVYADVLNYYKGLIAFRKAHSALRLRSAAEVSRYACPIDTSLSNVAAFQITTSETILAIFNANDDQIHIPLPEGRWNVHINAQQAGTAVLDTLTGTAAVASVSALVLVKQK